MGFSPALIEMPDGRRFVMKGMTSFMVVPGYDARDARFVDSSFFKESPSPPIIEGPADLVSFIVDGEPGWMREEPDHIAPVPKRRGWFRRLLGP